MKIIPFALVFAVRLAQGGMLLPCTGTDLAVQEVQQTNCIVTIPAEKL